MQTSAPDNEKQYWVKQGAETDKTGLYTQANKPILPKNLYKAAAILSHGPCHVSTGGMTEFLLKKLLQIMCNLHKTQPTGQCKTKTREIPRTN